MALLASAGAQPSGPSGSGRAPAPSPGASRYRATPGYGARPALKGHAPTPRPRDEGSLRRVHAQPADAHYRSPIGLALSPDGATLYVGAERQDRIYVVDTAARQVTGGLETGPEPFGLQLDRSGQTLFVANRGDNTVSEIDLATGGERRRLETGDDPHGLALGPDGRSLLVANLATHDLSLLDLASGAERVRLTAGRGPFDVATSPDGRYAYVSAQYGLRTPFRTPSVLELTTVDLQIARVVDRRDLPDAVLGQGVAVSPDGRFVVVAVELPKNLLPETQIYQGWMVTYAVAVAEARPGGRVAYLLLDEPNLYYPDPYGVAFSRDGRYLYVTSAGADLLSVVDWQRGLEALGAQDGRITLSPAAAEQLSRDLTASAAYVVARVPTGRNPKEVVVSPDDRRIYVASRLSDSVTVIARDGFRPLAEIALGGPEEVTKLRRGEIVFSYGSISFQRQLSCATCHPENALDGLVYDIAADGGMGRNLTDNRTLRGIAETGPFKWSGKNPTLARQEGPRAAQLFFRSHGFVPDDVEAITAFIESIPMRPNRFRGEELNEFQRRGQEIFERAWTNDGRYIPVANRCVTCHPAPYYTDRLEHDVGSAAPHDDVREFDTPQLGNLHERAPYLHDGRCWSLEEIWTEFIPYDTHGITNDLLKEQLNDLVEYLKTL